MAKHQLDLAARLQELTGPGSPYYNATKLAENLTGLGSPYYNATKLAENLTSPGSPYYNATKLAENLTGPGSHYYNTTFPRPNIGQPIRNQLAKAITTRPTAMDQLRTAMPALTIRDQLAQAMVPQPRFIDQLGTSRLTPTIRDQLAESIAGMKPMDQMRMGLSTRLPYSQLAQAMAAMPMTDQIRAGLFGPAGLAQGIAGPWIRDPLASASGRSAQPSVNSDHATVDPEGRFLVVDDADTANSLLRWLRDRRPSPHQVEYICRWLALVHAMIIVAQWKAGFEVSPVVQEIEVQSELFLALVGFVFPWI